MLAAMDGGGRQSFEPAGAGAILVSATALGVGIGALVGWVAGSTGYGVLAGAVAGVPAGVFAVYRRYRGYFAG
jgi:F0F1-type ATP synthase assembly protein I